MTIIYLRHCNWNPRWQRKSCCRDNVAVRSGYRCDQIFAPSPALFLRCFDSRRNFRTDQRSSNSSGGGHRHGGRAGSCGRGAVAHCISDHSLHHLQNTQSCITNVPVKVDGLTSSKSMFCCSCLGSINAPLCRWCCCPAIRCCNVASMEVHGCSSVLAIPSNNNESAKRPVGSSLVSSSIGAEEVDC